MSAVGRKPKPYNLKLLEGNPGHKKLIKPIEVNSGIPTCPSWLTKDAKTEWKRISTDLHEAGLLINIDQVALAMYCTNYAIFLQCYRAINKEGGIAKYLKGKNSQTTTLYVAMNKAMDKVKTFCTEFGLTPSSRGRISLNPIGDGDDDDEDFD